MMKSMIYPLIVLHLGIFIGVAPSAMMKGETFLKILGQLAVTLIIAYVIALVVLIVVRAVLKAAPHSVAVDRFLQRIPFVGKARQNMAMARFCKVYHSCLLAGISMVETAGIASSASHSGVIREAGKRLVKAAQAGISLGPQFMRVLGIDARQFGLLVSAYTFGAAASALFARAAPRHLALCEGPIELALSQRRADGADGACRAIRGVHAEIGRAHV